MSNVIDVDFSPPRTLPEHLDEATRSVAELGLKVDRAVRDEKVWQSWERRNLLARIRDLRAELRAERANQFTDERVLAALRSFAGGEPVLASQVARNLFPAGEPTHSAIVRTGLALSRLASAGEVIRHRPADSRLRACSFSMGSERRCLADWLEELQGARARAGARSSAARLPSLAWSAASSLRGSARGWRALLTVDDEVATYCPKCARDEFSAA